MSFCFLLVRKHLSRWQFAGLFAKYLKKFVLVEVADSNFGCYQMSMILDAVGMHQAPMIVADALNKQRMASNQPVAFG